MGYTSFSKKLVEKYLKPNMYLLDFGSQNDYSTGKIPPPFISEWYKEIGIKKYVSIDLGGDNNSFELDCAYTFPLYNEFDVVCDFGFGEHIVRMKDYSRVLYDYEITSVYPEGEVDIELGYYNCWLNKFNACKHNGYIISENPKTGNWPGHGYTYIDASFYKELEKIAGLEVVQLGEHPAMGNDIDGWNIFSVLKKTSDQFPSYEEFIKLPIYKK